ncbi:3-oxoacyl-[acyl-carrier-protein] synthase [Tulasnella sp. 427]|nr:3-oxoacyl-[acyl-carrier-protein] synthase [Tulasnella sp. 427]
MARPGSIAKSLCDQILTMPIHGQKRLDSPDTVTHAIDFGPGGLSGIDGLTTRNLEGRGVRILIIGEKVLVKTSHGKIRIDSPDPIMVAGMTPTTVKAGSVPAVLVAGQHIELAGGGHYNTKAFRAKVVKIQSKAPIGFGITPNALYINQRQLGFELPLCTEKAGIIGALQAVGTKHIAFKPGLDDGIRQVVTFAAANPTFPIICQWTGGRAGGHHSYEDFHQPILATYGSICQQSNISLVAGSSFGDSEDVWPYISAHLSRSRRRGQQVGGHVRQRNHTVRSEFGERIHKVATCGVKLWKEFDDTVFNMPKEKRTVWLTHNCDSIIEKLNKDFSKPWFGWKRTASGRHFAAKPHRRLAPCVGESFAGVDGTKSKASVLQSYTSLADPAEVIKPFLETYAAASVPRVACEDKAYFLAIAYRPGLSLAAEDIEAVFDQNPQRVCILQGPIATKHYSRVDEPISELLGTIESDLVKRILKRYRPGDESKVPTLDYIGALPMIPGVRPLKVGDICTSEAKVVSIINNDRGKSAKVKVPILRGGRPIIEVTSAFLYRSSFTGYQNTFEIAEKVPYAVDINSKAEIAVLADKEWYSWSDSTKPLLAGTRLFFHTESSSATSSSSSCPSAPSTTVTASRTATLSSPSSNVAVLRTSSLPNFENGGYSLTSSKVPSTFLAPATNQPYSKISGDFDPIHINPYFSDTHPSQGPSLMACGRTPRLAIRKTFTLSAWLLLAINQRVEKVISGTAAIPQASVIFVFTGQGSQGGKDGIVKTPPVFANIDIRLLATLSAIPMAFYCNSNRSFALVVA